MLMGPYCDTQYDMEKVLSIYHQLSATTEMSEHGHKLKQVSQTLGGMIRRTDQILTHLLRKREVTSQEYDEIRSESIVYNLTRHLIDVLSSKNVTAYQCFLDALNMTDQQHLCQLLEQGVKVDIGHQEALIDHCSYLKTNLNVTETRLLDHLLQSHVLDEQEMEEIKAKRTEREKVDQLLHFMIRTSPEQYQLFLVALRAVGETYITEVLAENRQTLANTPSKQLQLPSEGEGVSKSVRQMIKKMFLKRESTILLRVAENHRKPNQAIDPVPPPSTLFLSKSTALRVIPGKGTVYGIVVLGIQLFIACHGATSIEVYDVNNISSSTPSLLKIRDEILNCPRLAACSHYNCLYVSHLSGSTEPIMSRVELSNSSVSRWTKRYAAFAIRYNYASLSLTNKHSVLETVYNEQRVLEYTTHGELIREINIDSSIDSPYHCIQLSDGNFVICHGGSKQHRVCMVDASGRIIKSYGGSPGSGVGQLNSACQLSVNKYDHVFVADRGNNRIQLLSPTLTLLGMVQTPGHQLDRPISLHFDNINHRLFVSRRSDVLVVELSI